MCFIMMETLVCPPSGQGTPLHLPEPPSSLSSMLLCPLPRQPFPVHKGVSHLSSHSRVLLSASGARGGRQGTVPQIQF